MVPSPAAAPEPSLSSAPAAAADASAAAVTSPPVGALTDQRAKQAARTSGADEWIAQIRTLRSDGRMTEAAGALKAFRAAFNDADRRLPEDLREWAKTVR